MSLDC